MKLPPLHELRIGTAASECVACPGREAGSPFACTITQQMAERWYDKGDPLGKGAYGDTKMYKVPENELRGGPWITIKHFERDLRNATLEHHAHQLVWERSGAACRKYLAMPACMEFPEHNTHDVYTVQMLVNELPLEMDGTGVKYTPSLLNTDTFNSLSIRHSSTLRAIPPRCKEMIARQFGDMLGCFVKAGMRHEDLHGDNILVTHNLDELDWHTWRDSIHEHLYVRFYAIDWGLAEEIDPRSYDVDGVPYDLCNYVDPYSKYDPEYDPSYDPQQRAWRLMFAVYENREGKFPRRNPCRGETWSGLTLLFDALYHTEDERHDLPVDDVPRALIVDWVRMAWLARVGLDYPLAERETMDAVIVEERTVERRDRTRKSKDLPDQDSWKRGD